MKLTWTENQRFAVGTYDGDVKILLPPSEGKTPANSGPPLDLPGLSAPDLTPQRKKVLAALQKVSKRKDALTQLGVGASLAADVERNVGLDTLPCAPALLTYSGVLYEAMGAPDLVADAMADETLAQRLRNVHVFSALFGQVNGLDPIPAYRLAMKTDLGTLGKLSSWWKPVLAKSLMVDPAEVILDCRSSDYRGAWPGPHEQVITLGAVKVIGAKRSVVSHWAKYYRGELVGRLLADDRELPANSEDLVSRAEESYEVEFTPHAKNRPAALSIILRD
ncbi:MULTISPECIES: YaaA family protein [unclassified Brevibacterium]|uniref:YaaA family protein n=1 Tax=unclassified Brevibacterium TaxID=2614124 RepID=UPI0018689323|nr:MULTISPECIES: peroxide stress protein YaaA [unclassified Brevibacterium]